MAGRVLGLFANLIIFPCVAGAVGYIFIDQLSAIVATNIGADLLIMLSDIDGFYDGNPNADARAQLLGHIEKVDQHTYKLAGGSGSRFGTGGITNGRSPAGTME